MLYEPMFDTEGGTGSNADFLQYLSLLTILVNDYSLDP